jgi:hypothetical protein
LRVNNHKPTLTFLGKLTDKDQLLGVTRHAAAEAATATAIGLIIAAVYNYYSAPK